MTDLAWVRAFYAGILGLGTSEECGLMWLNNVLSIPAGAVGTTLLTAPATPRSSWTGLAVLALPSIACAMDSTPI